jgi:CRISPR-associated protein Cas2
LFVLVTYDIHTKTPAGKKRLRNAAKICLNFGQRVQNSVFELSIDPGQWANCRNQLLSVINKEEDSVRFYLLGSEWRNKVEHQGTKPGYDVDGTIII